MHREWPLTVVLNYPLSLFGKVFVVVAHTQTHKHAAGLFEAHKEKSSFKTHQIHLWGDLGRVGEWLGGLGCGG